MEKKWNDFTKEFNQFMGNNFEMMNSFMNTTTEMNEEFVKNNMDMYFTHMNTNVDHLKKLWEKSVKDNDDYRTEYVKGLTAINEKWTGFYTKVTDEVKKNVKTATK